MSRTSILFIIISAATAALFIADMLVRSVALPAGYVWNALLGPPLGTAGADDIVLHLRPPHAITALVSGWGVFASWCLL